MDVSEVQLAFSHMVSDVIENYLAIKSNYRPDYHPGFRDEQIAQSIAAMANAWGIDRFYGREPIEQLLTLTRDLRVAHILLLTWDKLGE